MQTLMNEVTSNPYEIEKPPSDDMVVDVEQMDEELGSGQDLLGNNQELFYLQLKNLTSNQNLLADLITEDFLDDIDHCHNSNAMVEAIVKTLANISYSVGCHRELLDHGVIEMMKRLLQIYCPYAYGSPAKQSHEWVEVNLMSMGNINLLKSISVTIQNLTKNPEAQEIAIKRDIVSIIKHEMKLNEYEVLTNLYLSLGHLTLTKYDYVKRRSVELGCLSMLLEANENT